MAKHRSLAVRSAPNVIVMSPPRRGGKVRRAASHVGRHVRRHGKSVARAGAHAVPIALAGAVVGWLDGKGYLDKLPVIGGSKAVTLGIAGYAATRFVRNQHVRNAGLATLAAAAFDFGRQHGGGVSGFDGVAGDGGAGPHSGQGY